MKKLLALLLALCLVLVGCTPAAEGSVRDLNFTAAWQHHIGGGADET